MTASPQRVLEGIDRAVFAAAFVDRLRARGCGAGFTAMDDFVRALDALPAAITDKAKLYWTARVCLVRRHSDIAVFDAVFDAAFERGVLALDPNARRTSLPRERNVPAPMAETGSEDVGTGLPWATLPRVVGGADDDGPESDHLVAERLPGALAGLADVPFERLDPRETDLLGAWLRRRSSRWPTRRSRRMIAARAGRRVALRPTIARSRRTGWEQVELVRVRQVLRPRRVVMLCDVSQSMQAQAVAYLHLMRALALNVDAEVFAFGTTLTRLTVVLAHRSAETAIELASAKVTDRFGGTRIATNVAALLASHHSGVVRGAIVVVASDGWDSDGPAELARAMARLQRRAHRVVWINPRASAPGFEPRVGALAAALTHCDALLPADTFASLAAVIDEISGDYVSSRGSRGSRAGIARP